jgi:hypothetical protein
MPILKPIRGLQINRSHPLAKGLIAAWVFNEAGGNKTRDFVRPGRTASVMGTLEWKPGNRGAALFRDATGEYVECSGFPFISPPLTIVSWANRDNSGGNVGNLGAIAARGSGSANNTNYDFGVKQSGSSRYPYLYWKDASTSYGGLCSSNYASEVNNKWFQLVGIIKANYDGEIYLNGRSIWTDTGNSAPTDGSQNLKMFRSELTDSSYYFPGYIDHVFIWNRELSAAEIAWLYREPFAMFERALVGQVIYALGPVVWLTGSASSTASVSAQCKVTRKVTAATESASDVAGLLKVTRKITGGSSGLSAASGNITIAGDIFLVGVVTASSALSGVLALRIRGSWFSASLNIERWWLREVLFNGVSSNAVKLGVVLTGGWFWVRNCGCTALYRGSDMEQIDFANVLSVVEQDAAEIEPPSYLLHKSGSAYFYVVRRFNHCGYQECTLQAAVKVSINADGNIAQPQPNSIFASKLKQVEADRVQLVWFYCPLEQKSKPVRFKIYGDNRTGQVDYQNPIAIVNYQRRKYYSYKTGALQMGRYLFAIRAEDADGVENDSLAQSRVELCSSAPDSITILSAKAI